MHTQVLEQLFIERLRYSMSVKFKSGIKYKRGNKFNVSCYNQLIINYFYLFCFYS